MPKMMAIVKLPVIFCKHNHHYLCAVMKYKLSPEQPGLTPHAVVITPYDSRWPALAAEEAKKLATVLGTNLIKVEHIGSTSVPGLSAKPVIDLIPIVHDLDEVDKKQTVIEALSYGYHGEFGINGRRFCTLTSTEGIRLVHLHIFRFDSEHLLRHLAFRDYLVAHPAIAQEYEQEKRRAAALHPHDSLAYNDEKAAWIKQHEAKAVAWYTNKG